MAPRTWKHVEWNGKEWIRFESPMPWYWRLRYWVRDTYRKLKGSYDE